MRSVDKAFIQAYNAQATVDAETHIIVAADLTNQALSFPGDGRRTLVSKDWDGLWGWHLG